MTFTYLGLKTDAQARVHFGGQPSRNLFVAGEMMAGNVLGQGYTAGVGMSIGTAFGRIAGTQAAAAARLQARRRPTLQSLEALTREAAALGANEPACAHGRDDAADEQEVARVLQICNACRYCEGFCAVFPAMTRRLEFPQADVHYLANLCHHCGACLHACQYAPPHDFAVNVPRAMARVRREHVRRLRLAIGARRRCTAATAWCWRMALALALALFLALGGRTPPATCSPRAPRRRPSTRCFRTTCWCRCSCRCLPSRSSRWAWACGASGAPTGEGPATSPAAAEAARHALTLKYLDGGHGDGCNEESDRFTLQRRRFHHLTFYGFVLCFLSTSVATLYHYLLAQPAPYSFTSLPKLLGMPGGVALMAGTAGLLALQLRRHPLQRAPEQRPMDLGFIGLLFLTAASGLALALSHGTSALTLLLCLHLGAVMALFLTLPYGKFAHAVYRCAALLKWSIERRKPSNLQLGDD